MDKHFKIKTLSIKNLDIIYEFITNNYIEDENILRLTYSKDFLYWFLKLVPEGWMIGLIYENNIIGFVSAILVDVNIVDIVHKMPYIDFLTVQKNLRSNGLAKILIDKLQHILKKSGFDKFFSNTKKEINNMKPILSSKDYLIPINIKKLRHLEFIDDSCKKIPFLEDNPLHLMQKSDLESVVSNLNHALSGLKFKPVFNMVTGKHFLLPKKNIVYTFVNRINNEITDMITIYKHYYYCFEKKEMLSVAQLGFYFNNILSLTNLVQYLLEKIEKIGIDQLIFRNLFEADDICLEKYDSYTDLFYYLQDSRLSFLPKECTFFPF